MPKNLISILFVLNAFLGCIYGACPAPGTPITANGTTVTEEGCAVSTNAQAALLATNSGTINLSDTTVTTTGNNATGARVMTGGTINFIDGSITTNGSLSFGASAFSGTINLTNVSVLSGDIALDASQLGVINFTNGTIGTQGGYVGPAVFSQFGANINLKDRKSVV